MEVDKNLAVKRCRSTEAEPITDTWVIPFLPAALEELSAYSTTILASLEAKWVFYDTGVALISEACSTAESSEPIEEKCPLSKRRRR